MRIDYNDQTMEMSGWQLIPDLQTIILISQESQRRLIILRVEFNLLDGVEDNGKNKT